ncbi:hypothetical protein KJ891_01765, partial [Candidatus Micrarchaeota archaeon]|nr:hypothetical protein [Candidatus Micrarchaeota archaeon]
LAPLQALAMLKERRTLGLEKEFKELAKVSEILEKNASSGAQTGTATAVGGVWSLPGGRTGIYEKIAQELSNTSETIVFCSTKRGIKRKTNAFRHKLDFLSKKGVKVVFNASSQGARFVVFDKNKAVLFLDPDGTDSEKERAVLIESPHFAGYLSNACRK